MDHYILLDTFLLQVSAHLLGYSKNEFLLKDDSFNSFNSVKQVVRMNLMDSVYRFVKHGLYQHYMKGGNASMLVEYFKRMSPLLPVVADDLQEAIMSKAYDVCVATYLSNFINWTYIKMVHQETNDNESDFTFLEMLKKGTNKIKNFFQEKVFKQCEARNSAKIELILDYVRITDKEKILDMYVPLIRSHIILEENMLSRMIYIKTSCLENIHNAFEKKKTLLKSVTLNTDFLSKQELEKVKLRSYMRLIGYKGWLFKRHQQNERIHMGPVRERQLKLMPGCTPYWATLQGLVLTLYTDYNDKEPSETYDLKSLKAVTKSENVAIILKLEESEAVTLEFDDNYQRNDWFYLITEMLGEVDKSEDVG